jgi:Flp pilus assembly secretin CpaC/tetratricopeptide (TPR) repeat protein
MRARIHPSPVPRRRPLVRALSALSSWLALTFLIAFAAPQLAAIAQPQSTSASSPAQDQKSTASDQTTKTKPVTGSNRRRAASLYLEASKQFQKEKFEEAMLAYQRAAELDPSNPNYHLSAELARSHLITALIQQAAKARIVGDASAERAALEHARDLDPSSIQVAEHLREMGEDATRGDESAIVNPTPGSRTTDTLGPGVVLTPAPGMHSFHLHTDQRQIVQQVFKAYGLEATIDDSVRIAQVRFDIDDASFAQATRVLALVTNTFYVPLDAHRALVARDTADNRRQFVREDFETVYLPGLTPTELTDVTSIAKNVFDVQQVTSDASAGTVLLRAPIKTLTAFNETVRQIMDGHSQVMLEVRMIQIAHTSGLTTGLQPPQSITAFNVYAEEQGILNANQSLVQQIISSGLAAPGDTLAILGILLASGQVSGGALTNGVALFGGGLTSSALAPGTATFNLNLNSSDSRELDMLQLHLGDGEAGTVRSGTRYPIQTSSFSGLGASLPSIPGLTGVGSSSALAGLLSNLGSSVPNIPQVEYQDLGLTLKATPKVIRNNDVALTIDMKLTALAGTSINGNPILNNRAYSGVVTLRQGEGVVIVSDIDKEQTRSISGVPGLSEIPGLNDVTANDNQQSYATLLIIMTPHVIRGTQAAGHSPMFRIDKNPPAR